MITYPQVLAATKKALIAGPTELVAAITLGGLASLMPSESVVVGGIVMVALLLLDLVTGAAAAWYAGKFDGNVLFRRTVAKMVGYSCSILAVYAVIWGVSQAAALTPTLKRDGVAGAMLTVLSILILHEARSVLINSAQMDLPVLGQLGKWLKRAEKRSVQKLNSVWNNPDTD
ncbi:MAG: phage holin family protein [Pseudomonadota bacterium]